jgi:hypothetical protein
MASNLQERFEKEVLSGEVDYLTFFWSLDDEDSTDVIELCRGITASFEYSEKPHIVKAAFTKLAHLRDLNSYPALEQLRGVWKDTYLGEYRFLIALMENAQNGAICNCDVYQDGTFNAPPYQSELVQTGRDTKKYDEYMETELIFVKCSLCNREWEVEIDHSYHYPHSHWRLKKEDRG